MSRQPQTPNEQLRSCLDELGWSPKTLARKINKTFGDGSVAESAPYHWRDRGRLPRAPLPTVVAHVLSEAVVVPILLCVSASAVTRWRDLRLRRA